MGRRRFGVAVLVPRPTSVEVDGLRRAFGDHALARIAPHVTMVPPVNVRDEDVAAAVAAVDAAARAARPLALSLGAAATFWPTSPVLYLTVAEAVAGSLLSLRDGVFVAPLARPIGHEFVPHVTIGHERGPHDRLAAGVSALSDYHAAFVADGLTLVELLPAEGPGDQTLVWTPIHEAPLGGPLVVARGPMEVELTTTAVVSDDALALLAAEFGPDGRSAPVEGLLVERVAMRDPVAGHVVLTARREGALLGVLIGHRIDGFTRVEALVVAPEHRGQGVAGHLQKAFAAG